MGSTDWMLGEGEWVTFELEDGDVRTNLKQLKSFIKIKPCLKYDRNHFDNNYYFISSVFSTKNLIIKRTGANM